MARSKGFDPRSARTRVLAATVAGLLAGASAWEQGRSFALLVGWNAASVVLLILAWMMIAGASPEETEQLAGAEDPGRTLIYVVVLVTSSVSLLAALVLSRDKTLPTEVAHRLSPLCLATVAIAWGLTHTAFTLRYARLYYRADKEGVGGVEFPDKQSPSYFDFAYFAFTIGMCFQTSDVCIASPQIRRAVLLHALIAFTYNTAILAFVLNLVFGSV
jgi:uncharacterized membrane protein